MLEEEIEDLNYQLKKNNEKEKLLEDHRRISLKLEEILQDPLLSDESSIENIEIRDQISLLKFEQNLWERKINTLEKKFHMIPQK